MAIVEGQILTPEKKSLLVDEINQELNSVNQALKSGGNKLANTSLVQTSKSVLQSILNDLFSKKGVITPDETNKALEAINQSKKARLQSDFYGSIKNSTIVIIGFIGVAIGIYYYTKNKSK
jgi:hypothetical protein